MLIQKAEETNNFSPKLHEFPGERHYVLPAGELSGLTRQSRAVVLACGLSNTASLLAEEFGCRVTAFDVSSERISQARDEANRRGVADLITFDLVEPQSADYPSRFFDVAFAEGGALTYLGRRESLAFARRVLKVGGYLAFSDLIYTNRHPPAAVRAVYEDGEGLLEEETYLRLLSQEGFGVIHQERAKAADWDRHYEAMRARCREAQGRFANPLFARAMLDEIETYYQRGGRESVGYLFALAKYFS